MLSNKRRITTALSILIILLSPVVSALENIKISFDNSENTDLQQSMYVLVKAVNTKGKSCYLQLNAQSITCVVPDSHQTSDDFSYKLQDLPETLQIPKVISGRIYISVGQPLELRYDNDSEQIIDPDGFKIRDVNYYTLYDKVEFSHNDAGVWINPTAVDFFSLPLQISVTPGNQQAGLGLSREVIMQQLVTSIKEGERNNNNPWQRLFLQYNDNDYLKSHNERCAAFNTVNTNCTILRMMAPGKAMVEHVQAEGKKAFPADYLANDSSMNYINSIWDYYRSHTIKIDVKEIASITKLSSYLYTGTVVGDKFIFTNEDATDRVTLDKPKSSVGFFAGAQGTFDAVNNTPRAVIVRQFTSAFDAGLLPTKDGALVDRAYFDNARTEGEYFKDNPRLPQADLSGPWYDLYSKVLHQFGEKLPIYTFAYDDALGQDGTLYIHPDNVAKSTITIKIGDMRGVKLPQPFHRFTANVTVIGPKNSNITVNGRTLTSTPMNLVNVESPLDITLAGKAAKLYLDPVIVKPGSTQADGIVVKRDSGSRHQYTVYMPSI